MYLYVQPSVVQAPDEWKSESSASLTHSAFFPTMHQPLPAWTFMLRLSSSLCILTFLLCANPPCFYPRHLSILPTLYLSQYFDEEQDDHEYPYYYEETTGRPSSSAPPSPQPGAPSQQVKREQEGREMQAGLVEGKENERGALEPVK